MTASPDYGPVTEALAAELLAVVAAWERGSCAALDPTQRAWRVAEALHLLTWHRPLAHAPLGLLLDEERQAAASGFAA